MSLAMVLPMVDSLSPCPSFTSAWIVQVWRHHSCEQGEQINCQITVIPGQEKQTTVIPGQEKQTPQLEALWNMTGKTLHF